MTKIVVTHHAHHPDEDVYRLVFAVATDHEIFTVVDNPDYDPELNGDNEVPATLTLTDVVTTYSDHVDIVWAVDDKRWKGMSAEDIASAQRADVSDMLAKRAREAVAEAIVNELPGVGTEL